MTYFFEKKTLEFLGSKTHGNSTRCFLDHLLAIPLLFQLIPRISTLYFFNALEKFHVLNSPPMDSTSWKCSLHFVDIFRTNWNFLIKFCSFDPSFNRNILRSQYLKFRTSAHAHIAITYFCVLFTNFLSNYEYLYIRGLSKHF